jgi:hypothetical protein
VVSRPPALVLFGAGSLCGEALLSQLPEAAKVLCPARHRPACAGNCRWQCCDLEDLSPPALDAAAAALPGGPQRWISFAPIWLLAPFVAALARRHEGALAGLEGVVACSSSSVITKRFAANRFDRELVGRLAGAQEQLLQACGRLGVPCRILAPTLIHGRSAHAADRNVEALRCLLRRSPLLPLPAHTGLRQPIAAADLAAVAWHQSQVLHSAPAAGEAALLPLGGDETLSYRALLERIQAADRRAARCRLVSLPTPLFQWLASPLLLVAPKSFAAVQRLSADLAGFPRAADLLGRPPRPFAVPAP